MSEALIEELRQALAEVVGKEVADVSPDDDLVQCLGVDSLTGLRWLAVIEKKYGVLFPDERLGEYRSLEAVRQFLVEHGKGAGR